MLNASKNTERIIVYIPAELKNQFHHHCVDLRQGMSTRINELIAADLERSIDRERADGR